MMMSKIVSKVHALGLKRPDQIVAFTMGFASAASMPALTLHLYGKITLAPFDVVTFTLEFCFFE